MRKLVVFRGDEVEQEIRLSGTAVRIGRDAARNDLVLDDASKSVSRAHAEIRAEGNRYFIVDLKSNNGVWINGQRIKNKAEILLGVPITVGSYELVLENEVAAGAFDQDTPPLGAPTIVNTVSASQKGAPDRTGTPVKQAARPPMTQAERRQMLAWLSAAVGVALISGMVWAALRNIGPPPVAAETSPSGSAPSSPPSVTADIALPPAPPMPRVGPEPPDLIRVLHAQYVADASDQRDADDCKSALQTLEPVLALDPDNSVAGEIRQGCAIIGPTIVAANAGPKTPSPPPVPPSPPPSLPDDPDIPRGLVETPADYGARVLRIRKAIDEGKKSVERGNFTEALTHFRSAEREPPRHRGLDLLIADATRKGFDQAMTNGVQAERDGYVARARQWYQTAMSLDRTSADAKEKEAAAHNKATGQATRLMNRATLALKTGDKVEAKSLYLQVIDLLLVGDDMRETAAKQLEALK